MRVVHDLSVAARRWLQIQLGRVPERDQGWLDPALLAAAAADRLADLGEDVCRLARIVEVPVDRPPWHPTGIGVVAGEHVSILAAGRVWLSRPLEVWVGPRFQLWARTSSRGPLYSPTRETNSFAVDADGELELASYFPGEWKTPDGRLGTDPDDYRGIGGRLLAVVLVWRGTPQAGLQRLVEAGDICGLAARELDRLEHAPTLPQGWKHLWFIGDSEIYRAESAPAAQLSNDASGPAATPAIRCSTCADVGIVRKAVDVALGPDTTLSWRWRVDRLPSLLPEDTMLSHDYMSIAVEFEDGRDITYFWSRELPVETAFWCPLPAWKDREFHVVVRSGGDGLGRWHAERRNLYEDCRRWMGKPPPRIVSVWIIANSLMQRSPGESLWASIRVEDAGGAVDVL